MCCFTLHASSSAATALCSHNYAAVSASVCNAIVEHASGYSSSAAQLQESLSSYNTFCNVGVSVIADKCVTVDGDFMQLKADDVFEVNNDGIGMKFNEGISDKEPAEFWLWRQ